MFWLWILYQQNHGLAARDALVRNRRSFRFDDGLGISKISDMLLRLVHQRGGFIGGNFTLSLYQRVSGYPFISLPNALRLLRISTAILFAAHALTRIVKGTIPQFGLFMESVGFPFGVAWVWAITAAEIVAALLLIANRFVRPAATVLFAIAFTGILLIHRHLGWWVGEHGTGGAEYSVALIMMLLVVAAADREDHVGDPDEPSE